MTSQAPPTQSQELWTPQSWRSKPVGQPVHYPSPTSTLPQSDATEPDPVLWRRKQGLEEVVQRLKTLPPIVSAVEIERLKSNLRSVAEGKAFLLQGGDCAELFDYCSSEKIEHRLSLLLSMSLILIWGMKVPVVRVARMGGQYAKPRSSPTEKLPDGREVPSFRGHNVNGISPSDRLPDPERLLSAYFHSAATVNHVRSLLSSGFASLPTSKGEAVPWSLPLTHVRSPELLKQYEEIVQNLSQALEFMSVIGVDRGGGAGGTLDSAEVYVSHEALMLEYEAALTRLLPIPPFAASHPGEKGYYCTSAHFVWIGDRTRDLSGAHIEFFRGLRNPIGIKVGPSMQPDELVRLLDIVNPEREVGKVTLIGRYGAEKVEQHLPGHILAVQQSPHNGTVIWQSDSMHGNGKPSQLHPGVKTRHMHDIVSELSSSLRIHAQLGSRLGGVHLEVTGDLDEEGRSVTECLGGSMRLEEESLGLRFESYCDPRLNFEQSLDIAFLLSQASGGRGRGRETSKMIYEELASRPGSVDSRAGK
ncbi:hypothetical protein JCM8547_009416 [Rhodosporidiobolus lusitaniae]